MNRVQNEQKKGGLGIKEERKIIQSKYSQDHSSRGVDFYSAELLELVEEINKWAKCWIFHVTPTVISTLMMFFYRNFIYIE